MQGSQQIIDIDDIEFLSGEKAIQKGTEDTGCTREQISDCIPSMNNDFYIRNIDKSTKSYEVTSTAVIHVMENSGSPDLSTTTFTTFIAEYPNKEKHFGDQPFSFEVKDNVISKITEQYTP